MYDTILIPTDGSDEARKAAQHGIELAATLGTTVHTLYVMDLPGVPRALSIRDDEEQVRREYREYGERVTEEVDEMASDAGVECVTAIKSGTIHEEIVKYADDEGVDAIVMGTGYQGRFGALLGTIAEKVVRLSTVPVISTKLSESEARSRFADS
ncbi:universal stress protein [Halococcus saccharolyticus]|uniref:Stress response protein n=1 Tax=Halococcus saccharolyticus DSM 5350 TaxID=1227455 RepID=M0MTY0_9EURY|nr:universal stress protein [Halococcus saccharolyticus]EMA47915.1 stress response protein [Halococcus saccharolyticus DSM 5350]